MWFRDPAENETLIQDLRPMLKSVVALIFVFFIVPSIVYGRVTGSMKTDRDVIDGMANAMSSMGLYLVLVFLPRNSWPLSGTHRHHYGGTGADNKRGISRVRLCLFPSSSCVASST